MIEKKIHYCWFWRNEKSDIIKQCINSWKKHCPDFEIIEWNESNFNVDICNFTKQAYKQKKWAYIADYARFYILYNQWWIYLDTDMFLYKDLTPLLNDDFFLWIQHFIKWENIKLDKIRIAWGIIGMKKWHFLWKDFVNYYNNIKNTNIIVDRKFVIPTVIDKILKNRYKIKNENILQELDKWITIYPIEYFYAYDDVSKKEFKTNNTYSIHYWLWSWLTNKDRMKKYIFLKTIKILEILRIKKILFKFIKNILKLLKREKQW